jgi:hypothetical protein
MIEIVTDVEKFQLNAIAAGHNNVTGLVNLETVRIYELFLTPVKDVNTYIGGERVVNGRGVVNETGFPNQTLEAGYLTNAQRYWLQTEILRGKISGPVTFKAHRYAVPMTDGMTAPLVISNAIMTLPQGRSGQTYTDGRLRFDYTMTRIIPIEEEQLYGSIYVTGGSTAQTSIGTTAQKLTGFAVNGNYNGITPDHTDDDLTILVAGEYRVMMGLTFTGTLSTRWTFEVYKNGSATGIIAEVETNATPDDLTVVLGAGRTINLSVNDVLTVYVNSDDGGATAELTMIEGGFSAESIALA